MATQIQEGMLPSIFPAFPNQKKNEALCSENRTEMFVTAWVGILEISSGILTCANAGHEYPAVFRNGQFELLKDRHGFVLGGMEGSKYREYTLQLEKGEKIFVYTDGVPEAANHENAMFGTGKGAVLSHNQYPPARSAGGY